MTVGFQNITPDETFLASLTKLMSNDKAALTLNAGSSYPTTGLYTGMPCYRSDLKKLYIYSGSNWQLASDVSSPALTSNQLPSELSKNKVVFTVNGVRPDAYGNVTVSTGSGGGGVAGVSSVNGRTGAVSLTANDITSNLVAVLKQQGVIFKINGRTPDSSGNISVNEGSGGSSSGVSSVNGKSGAVTLTAQDVGAIPYKNTTYCLNANTWLTDGYTKVSDGTSHLPDECVSGTDKWGVLFFIAENHDNNAGTQTFYPIDGKYKGRIFTRSTVNGVFTKWEILAFKSEIGSGSGGGVAGVSSVNGRNGAVTLTANDVTSNLVAVLKQQGVVFKVNSQTPDGNGNVTIQTGGGSVDTSSLIPKSGNRGKINGFEIMEPFISLTSLNINAESADGITINASNKSFNLYFMKPYIEYAKAVKVITITNCSIVNIQGMGGYTIRYANGVVPTIKRNSVIVALMIPEFVTISVINTWD